MDFSFGTFSPAPGIPEDKFSVRWTGKIIPPKTIHQIGVSNDDGARLYLDGKLIIDDWHDHAEKANKTEVELQAGKAYEIVLEFYDNTFNADAKLTWDLRQKDFSKAKEVAAKKGTTPGLIFGNLEDPESEVRKILSERFTIRRKPELGTGPSVYYII